MPGAAHQPRATLTLDYLCGVLEHAGLVTAEQRREAIARGDVVHARLLRQRTAGPRNRGAAVGDGVHPAEVARVAGLRAGRRRALPADRARHHAGAGAAPGPPVRRPRSAEDRRQARARSSSRGPSRGATARSSSPPTTAPSPSPSPTRSITRSSRTSRTHVRREPHLVVVDARRDIQRLITDFYGFRGAVDAAEQQAIERRRHRQPRAVRQAQARRGDRGERQPRRRRRSSTSSTTRSTSARATSTSSRGASSRSVRMRIDGVLHNVHTLAQGRARRPSSRASRRSRASTSPRSAARRTGASRRRAATARSRCASRPSPSRSARSSSSASSTPRRAAARPVGARDVRAAARRSPRSSSRGRTGSSW